MHNFSHLDPTDAYITTATARLRRAKSPWQRLLMHLHPLDVRITYRLAADSVGGVKASNSSVTRRRVGSCDL